MKAIIHLRHKRHGHQYLVYDNGQMDAYGQISKRWDSMGQMFSAEEMKDVDSVKEFFSEFDYELKELN